VAHVFKLKVFLTVPTVDLFQAFQWIETIFQNDKKSNQNFGYSQKKKMHIVSVKRRIRKIPCA